MVKEMLVLLWCMFSVCAWADEKLLFGFENADIARINLKMSEGVSWTRCRVTSVPGSGSVTLSLGSSKVAVGNEFIILHLGAYAGDVKVTAVDAATSTAKVLNGVANIVAGDSAIMSWNGTVGTRHDTLTGSMALLYPRYATFIMLSGNSSEGQYAMGLSRVATLIEDPLATYNSFLPIPPADPEPWQYYGMFHNGRRYLSSANKFGVIIPKDWSAYDLLRMDVYAKDVTQSVQVALEDEEIAPMALRTFLVTAGSWVTLEYDLRQAVRERNLDLSKITGLHVAVREASGKTINDTCCLLDNIRLATTGSTNTLPVVRDPSAMALPAYYKHNTTPTPETMPNVVPDRRPLAMDTPRVVVTDSALSFNVPGFISAFDNQNLIVGFIKEKGSLPVLTMKSSDGGAHWTGLAGEAGGTKVPSDDPREGNGRGEVVGARGDVLMLAVNCTGDYPGLKEHAYVWSFDGTNWNRTCKLVDCDARHCPSIHGAAKSADGRLWTSYRLASRLLNSAINVHFSDDNGLSWKPSRENTAGLIPGSYGWNANALVPWGNSSVACLQLGGTATRPYPLVWTKFESGQWTAPDTVPVPKSLWTWSTYANSTPPYIKAVSLNGNEIFAICSYTYGVYHFKDGAWTREAVDIPLNSGLCVAGGKIVMAVGTTDTGSSTIPTTLKAWQYRNGSWSGPTIVVNEPKGFPFAMYSRMPGFYIPAASPPNFVPLAWVTARENQVNSIKFIRIPVDTTGTTAIQGPDPVLLQATLSVFPNPFSRTVAIRFASNARAAIFDVKGRRVWQADVSAGHPRKEWDSRSEARGVYVLKLISAGRQTRTLKLIKL